MKEIIVLTILLLTGLLSTTACESEPFMKENQLIEENMTENANPITGMKLKIKVGEKIFTATLSDNPTAKAFKALLPLTLNMNELNNNEKFAQLSKSLPINPSVPSSIQSGDLMMYGSKTLVLFYKGFSTTYSYTKIGKFDDITGLLAAVGTGDVSITFE